MQVTLDKQYPVAAPASTAWKILTDITELTTCMPGAQITAKIDDTHFKGSVKVKVGPALAAFAGNIEVLSVDAPTRTVRMLGKGADKGGSSASMELTATLVDTTPEACSLHGKADVIVNGKFAQFGGRMLTSVSDVILAQFASTFSEKARALISAQQSATSPAAAPGAQSAPTSVATEAAAAPGAQPTSTAAEASIPPTPAPPKELNALTLFWTLLRGWLANLFGRKARTRST